MLSQFHFYLSTNMPRLKSLENLYFLTYQYKFKIVQSCLNCMIEQTYLMSSGILICSIFSVIYFGVLFLFLSLFSFFFIPSFIFFFHTYFLEITWILKIILNMKLQGRLNIQSPWDPMIYRILTVAWAGDGTSLNEVSRT